MSEPNMELASGIAAFEAKEFANALKLLSPLAEQGDPRAQYRMAIMHQNGLGVVKNDLLAFKWMRAAAEQGIALAQHGLGFMYLQGECAPKNAAEAFRWFQKAAEQGLAGSQMTLGMMYEQGLGVPQNEPEARKWYWTWWPRFAARAMWRWCCSATTIRCCRWAWRNLPIAPRRRGVRASSPRIRSRRSCPRGRRHTRPHTPASDAAPRAWGYAEIRWPNR